MYCLSITITEDQREIADAVGYSCNMGGCVEEQSGDNVILTFYFDDESDAQSAASSFAKSLSILPPTIDDVPDEQDWNAKWRESMEPAEIADGVWVSPTWLEPPSNGRVAWIKIEPKMAFGTGHHETTRLAAKEILARKNGIANKSALDIGTGSGVLCFVADLAGADHIVGVEIDGCCLENLAENLRDNPPNGHIDFMIGTIDTINTNKKFDVVIMNMLMTESSPLLEQIVKITHDKSLLIWSGILTSEKDEVVGIAEKYGFKLSADQTENEWWCGTFAR